jgi:flagellum-specific peptidoglycan hydrolase FlgJ
MKKILFSAGLIALYILYTKRKKMPTATPTKNKSEFIQLITPSAKAIEEKIGVPYKFIIAQICLETNFGKSSLTKNYYNFGGIKAVKGQPFVSLLTTECIKGVCSKVYQNFAIFNSVIDGLTAQAKIYQNKYFKKYLNKTSDPLKYAQLIQSGTPKYATDPNYVSKIEKILKTL